MPADPGGAPTRAPAVVPVPEIRDYLQINRRLVQLLDAGVSQIRLVGVEWQRLLVAGLRGSWEATVELEGEAGPELAADLDAPGLLVLMRGAAADGAGRGLRAGRLIVSGAAGPGVGYAQQGGVILVTGPAEGRAGLEQRGGLLTLAGSCGPLAGERQAGGTLVILGDRVGPGLGLARHAGRLESPVGRMAGTQPVSDTSRRVLERLRHDALERFDLLDPTPFEPVRLLAG